MVGIRAVDLAGGLSESLLMRNGDEFPTASTSIRS